MKAFLLVLIYASLLGSTHLRGQKEEKDVSFNYIILPGSKVMVAGSTNVNEFTCFSEQTISDPQSQINLTPLQDAAHFRNAVIKIRIESLECGNVVMNENLCTTMHSDKYPYIIIELQDVKAVDGKPFDLTQSTRMIANVYITLAGQQKMNVVQLDAVKTGTSTFHFSGKHAISLCSYGIQPPKALFGLIKVHDMITVQFDLKVQVVEAMVQ